MIQKRSFFVVSILIFSLVACGTNPKRVEEGDVHFQASKRLYSKGETIQSLSEAEQAARADDTNEEVQNFLALLYLEREDLVKAEEHYARAVKIKPEYSEAQNNYCALLLQLNRLDEALTHCLKAIENVTYSTPERAYNNMALIYQKKGEAQKAAEMHQKALIHNKNFVFSLLYLGKNSYNNHEFEKAKDFLSKADEACIASPNGSWGTSCPEAQYQLALTYLQLKQTPAAITAFQHCISSDAKGDLKTKCEKSLQMYKQ